METNDIPTEGPSDWLPITNKHDLAVLAKLGEEVSELGTEVNNLGKIIFRIIAQGGLDKCDPKTGKMNKEALEDEIADVFGLATSAIQRLGLDEKAISERSHRKRAYKEPWFKQLSEKSDVASKDKRSEWILGFVTTLFLFELLWMVYNTLCK